jgi:ferredoxin
VADADVVIDVPKLKTHGFMMLTGAVKNLFGCIPGLEKAQFHLKVPDRDDFGDMLIDLMLACRPALAIMDAVTTMEGEGPSGGTPRHMGALLASADLVAMDVVAAAMTDFDPMDVYTNRAAARRGLGPASLADVETVGVDPSLLSVEGFLHPAADVAERVPPWLRKWLRKRTASMPYLARPAECTSCRTCERNCPVSAIEMSDGRPTFDYEKCIRCYCCQELCPVQVIDLKTPGIVNLFGGGRGRKR